MKFFSGTWRVGSILTLVVIFVSVWVSRTHKVLLPEQESMVEQKESAEKDSESRYSPDHFARFHEEIRTRERASGPTYPANYQVAAWQEARRAAGIQWGTGKRRVVQNPLPWIERGPGNVAGRARAVVIDPADPSKNTWLLGTASGGVWKTTDAGQSWEELTADLPNLATTTLAIVQSNPETIYLGTGEGFGSFAFVYGQGIWKSENAGLSWAQLASTAGDPSFTNVLRLIVDPDDANRLTIAASTGFRRVTDENSYLKRSDDGGQTWQDVYESTSRIEQVIADPAHFDVQYATLNGQGILKSTDAGQTWTEYFEPFDQVGRLELVIAPGNSSILYVSAEGGRFESTLYRSDDAGENWEIVTDSLGENVDWLLQQGWYNNAIAVDPFDANTVYVGGVDLVKFNISEVTEEIGYVAEVDAFIPNDIFELDRVISGPETAVKLVRVSNLSSSEFKTVEVRWGLDKEQKAHRFTGKWLASYQDYRYVPFEVWDLESNKQLMVAYEDTDEDFLWDVSGALKGASERIFILGEEYDADVPHAGTTTDAFDRAQYVLTVFTNGEDEVQHGPFPGAKITIYPTVKPFRKAALNRVTYGYGFAPDHPRGVHVDHHQIVLSPISEQESTFLMLDANDGGLAFSYDKGATFTQTGDTFAQIEGGGGTTSRPITGLNTAQFYGIDKMNGADRYIGGTQDNGSWISNEDTDQNQPWRFTPGGDGFEAVWHYDDPEKIIQSSQFNTFFRSLDGGNTWQEITPPGGGPFLTRVGRSVKKPDVIFTTNSFGVVRSDDFGSSWEQTFIEDGWPKDAKPTVRVSLASPDIVWAGSELTDDHTLQVSVDGGNTFTPTSTYSQTHMGPVTDVATHPSNPNMAYALFSFAGAPKILQTNNLGQDWIDISGFGEQASSQNGFPDVAVYSLLVMPFDEDMIWAGTEIGLFESLDGGESWRLADNGLPAVAIWQMRIVNDEVVVATHGRGIWTAEFDELSGYMPSGKTQSPLVRTVHGGGDGVFSIDLDLRAPYDSTRVFVDGRWLATLAANEQPAERSIRLQRNVQDRTDVTITALAYADGTLIASPVKTATLYPRMTPQATFVTDFTEDDAYFLLDGFSISQPAGFTNRALHTEHPYADFETAGAELLAPIIIDESSPFLIFDEVIRVEAGEPGAPFGAPEFFDYVIVEGSEDGGFTWQPLLDGYDARASATWHPALDVKEPPTAEAFERRQINLLDHFPAGTQVVIRFRLSSDNALVGWGWAIDNVRIQDARATSVSEPEESFIFNLDPNYPNPFSGSTTISFSMPEPAPVSLELYDISGRQVREVFASTMHDAGRHRIEWDGRNDAGVPVASGIYFYRLRAGAQYEATRQLVVVR